MKLTTRRFSVLAVLAGAAALLIGTAAPAAAVPAFGTSPVVVPAPAEPTTITAVRVGRHVGFDRVVFDIAGPLPGYRVSYVAQVVEEGSGRPVPLAGAADILVSLSNTQWLTAPSPSVNISPGFPGLRQVRSAGEFEAQASYGVGQATKAGLRVFTLTAPNRVVVDVRHPSATVAPPQISQIGHTCLGEYAIVALNLRNPNRAEQSFQVRLSGGDVEQAQAVWLPAMAAERVEFHGLPSGEYTIEVLNDVGETVASAGALVECPPAPEK